VILQDVRYRARDDYIMLRYKHISHPHPEDPALLMEFFGIFDRIFFLGSLTRLCYVEIVDALPGADGDCTIATNRAAQTFHHPYEAKVDKKN
jgi:hypothetical protein